MRRINGGGTGKATFYVIPRFWPEILSQPEGPAIFHGAGFELVSSAKPARAGELLVMRAKGLGPTLPLLIPPGAKPFAAEAPFEEVNAPVEVKAGWPATPYLQPSAGQSLFHRAISVRGNSCRGGGERRGRAEVVDKVGWPGTRDQYRVDVRIPGGLLPGTATLQVNGAYLPGLPFKIPVQ